MTEVQKRVVALMTECNMNRSAVGRVVCCNPNNVTHHCNKIQEATGLDPRNFFDLVALAEKVGVTRVY